MWTSLAKLLFNLTVIYVICNPVEIHLTQQDETTTVLRDNQIHPKIGYVLPNSQYSQNASSQISSPLVKLAWVIHSPDEEIFVDVKDGTILGGKRIKQITSGQRRSGRPQAEYRKPFPVRDAIARATEIRIYGQSRISSTLSDWNNKPLATLNSRTNKDIFRLLKTTRRFGEFGVKTAPVFLFIFVVPGQPHQGYMYNGVLSELSVTGEAAILPDACNLWLNKYSTSPFVTRTKMPTPGSM